MMMVVMMVLMLPVMVMMLIMVVPFLMVVMMLMLLIFVIMFLRHGGVAFHCPDPSGITFGHPVIEFSGIQQQTDVNISIVTFNDFSSRI